MQNRGTGSDRPALRRRRGRAVAWLIAALCIALLAGFGWTYRRAIQERWSLGKQDSPDPGEWEPVVEKPIERPIESGSAKPPGSISGGSPVAPVSIDGLVEAVHSDEPIVVISVGKKQNVKPGYIFYVERGAEYIGKIKVNQVFDDLSGGRVEEVRDGQSVQVGDRVSTSKQVRQDR